MSTLTVDVTHQTNREGRRIGQRLAEPTDALARLFRDATVGDTLTVTYTKDGLTVAETGGVTEVSSEFGELRFGDSAYLHVNADTGDYHFSDSGRESPADGWEVQSITLRGGSGE